MNAVAVRKGGTKRRRVHPVPRDTRRCLRLVQSDGGWRLAGRRDGRAVETAERWPTKMAAIQAIVRQIVGGVAAFMARQRG